MEHVTPNTSEELRRAVEAFMRIKRSMNSREPKPEGFWAWTESLASEHFIDQRGGDYACWPETTLAAVLPFFNTKLAADSKRRPARVPVKSVLGSSYDWPEHFQQHDLASVEGRIGFFTSDERATTNWERADVHLIRQLGLFYVACEGKNRVAFLAHHGREWMPCSLEEQDYPSADRLRLIEIREGPQRSWLCVKDDRHVEFIAYPELTLPLLEAYGVRTGHWDPSWPMRATVMNSFRLQAVDYQLLDGQRSVPGHPVDLDHLAQRESKTRSPELPSRFMVWSHPGLAMSHRFLMGAAVVFLSLMLLGFLLQLLGLGTTALWWSSVCVGGGFVMGLSAPVRVRPQESAQTVVSALAADPCCDQGVITP